MHPEDWEPVYTSCKVCAEKDSSLRYVPEWERFDYEQSCPWWTREYVAARRRNRLRRTVRNVVATVVTFAAFTGLYVLVVAVEHG